MHRLVFCLAAAFTASASTVNATAFESPRVLDCKFEKIEAENGFWEGVFGFRVGDSFNVPIEQLTATGGEYAMRGLRRQGDRLQISRRDGTFKYVPNIASQGFGHCTVEQTKF